MVDIHSHILPGIDDGARDAGESKAMLQLAFETGTTDIVATPHADTQYKYDPEQVGRLVQEAQAYAPHGLRIHRGCDFHVMHDNIRDAVAHPARYTINGGRYLMVELNDMVIFPNTGQLYQMLEDQGMVIVLTHPERNPLIRQRIELIEEWVAANRLMQVTASSLLGLWGPKALSFSRLMLDKGLVHFIASDGHSVSGRPPRLDHARQWMERHYSAELASLLFDQHPRAVVEDRKIDLSEFPPRKSVATKGNLLSRLFGRGASRAATGE